MLRDRRYVSLTKRPSPRLWSADAGADWYRVGRLVDIHGVAQTVMVQLTGGVFLTGFALTLGAGALAIGVLAALPLATKIAQLVLSWWIERAGHWRGSAIGSALLSRTLLLLVPVLALGSSAPGVRLWLLVALVALSSLCASVFELSYLTWMAELIPEPLRGVFWGRRGRNAGVIGIVASIAASLLLDQRRTNSTTNGTTPARFAIVFGAGVAVGIAGVAYLACLPRPRRTRTREHYTPLRAALTTPLRDANFRTLVAFSAAWSFTSGYMAPFYMVYMLEQLRLSFLAVTILTAITNLLMAMTQTHWGRLGDHFGTKPVLRIGAYLIALTPLVWLLTLGGHVWPVVIVQILSGVGWSAFHVSLSNLSLKLAPETKRPSYLATFGAFSGVAEGVAPLLCGVVLGAIGAAASPSPQIFRVLVLLQFVLFGIATGLPTWIHEPGGTAVGHLIRVMARFRSMDASRPVALLFEHGYTHLARVADFIAREFPRDAEPI